MKYIVCFFILVLVVLHQDFWWWDSRILVFGFMPIGLAWHVGISMGAGVVWWLAVRFCWPIELDQEFVETHHKDTGLKLEDT